MEEFLVRLAPLGVLLVELDFFVRDSVDADFGVLELLPDSLDDLELMRDLVFEGLDDGLEVFSLGGLGEQLVRDDGGSNFDGLVQRLARKDVSIAKKLHLLPHCS